MKKLTAVLCITLIIFQTERIKPQSLSDDISELTAFAKASLSKWKNYGINLSVDLKNDFLQNISGGVNAKSAYIGLFNSTLTVDLDRVLDWKGANMLISAIGNAGNNFCDEVGAEQGIDNIEAFDTWKIYEFWIEQKLFNKTAFIKLGLYDLNSEFDTRHTSSIFINPSQGIGPDYSLTGKNGPSIFPTTSLAFRIKYLNNSGYYFQTAVLDGVPGNPNNPAGTHFILNKNDGFLLSAETGYVNNVYNFSKGYIKVSFGYWYYTSKFKKLLVTDISGNPVYQKGNYGIYLSAESLGGLWSESDNSGEGLAAFIRLGLANKNINKVDVYFGSGINYTGLIPGRDKDVFGAAVAVTHNSSKYITQMKRENVEVRKYESIIELTYLFHFSDWLNLQPGFQYVFNPAYCQSNDYSVVSIIRCGHKVKLS